MKNLRRSLSFLLVLLVWACQTNDPQIQLKPGQGARSGCSAHQRYGIKAALDDPAKHYFADLPTFAVLGNTIEVRWSGNSSVGSISFGNPGNLRAIIGCGTDDQAHHIVPNQWTFASGGAGYRHPVVQVAALDGYHPNDGYNGMCLPTTQHHTHQNYNDYVRYQLDSYESAVGVLTPSVANKWLQCKLKSHLEGLCYQMLSAPGSPTINNFFAPYAANPTFIGI